MLAWVETWRAQLGAYFPARVKAPRSATIRASTPASFSRSRCSGRRDTSSFRGMVLTVQWTRTPCSWAKATASGSSSGEKLPAKARMPKAVPARYTASAP